jgi:hypothetical protein
MSKGTATYQITLPVKVKIEPDIVTWTEEDIVKKGTKCILVVDPIAEIIEIWRGKLKDGSVTLDYLEKVRGRIN